MFHILSFVFCLFDAFPLGMVPLGGYLWKIYKLKPNKPFSCQSASQKLAKSLRNRLYIYSMKTLLSCTLAKLQQTDPSVTSRRGLAPIFVLLVYFGKMYSTAAKQNTKQMHHPDK